MKSIVITNPSMTHSQVIYLLLLLLLLDIPLVERHLFCGQRLSSASFARCCCCWADSLKYRSFIIKLLVWFGLNSGSMAAGGHIHAGGLFVPNQPYLVPGNNNGGGGISVVGGVTTYDNMDVHMHTTHHPDGMITNDIVIDDGHGSYVTHHHDMSMINMMGMNMGGMMVGMGASTLPAVVHAPPLHPAYDHFSFSVCTFNILCQVCCHLLLHHT
jgi:hypothetical protein